MGCGTSKKVPPAQAPTLSKKSVLPAIEPHIKQKSPSAKSNGSSDSGIEDSEPTIKKSTNVSKIPMSIDTLLIEHHQKSRLGYGETFDIMTGQKPRALAPLKHVPRFSTANKQVSDVDPDLEAKIAAKQERASRKRQEIEEARRLASSRIGHRSTKPVSQPPITTADETSLMSSKRDQRHQQLSMLRDQLRQNSVTSPFEPMHTPRASRPDSQASTPNDAVNLTPRRGGFVIGATTASNFKAVYD